VHGYFTNRYIAISHEAQRIHWTLESLLLEKSFTVVEYGNFLNPRNTPEPYYLGDSNWHRYSQSPFTIKPVSSITVFKIEPFNIWEKIWEKDHRKHYNLERQRTPQVTLFVVCLVVYDEVCQ